MLFSFLSLAIAISAIYINRQLIDDDIIRLLIKLIGLFGLFLSLVYSPWLIKLSIVVVMVVTPACIHQYYWRRIRCPPNCISRPNCRHISI